jgi:L-threonylcarbamoyladenylate synthase
VAATCYLPPRLRHAAAVLHAGGVIAYPTEGVYGLGCRPDDGEAVRFLLELKQRPVSAGLILIAASLDQLAGWIAPTPRESRQLTRQHAGAVTWLVTAGPLTPGWVTGAHSSVAVRVTRHPVAAGLCLAAGLPLISTSANRRGKPAARSALAARRRFGARLDLVVGGATGGAAGPSEIRDASSGRVIRAG